ncbi:DUF305 domain-containing protein [Paenibacillus pini]|uniref:DUF305 domain-containing protein n=1 Tax=Paenibacillus pini JCM 16418 TaxID=1236976 RepID=W7YJ04_9BACL|nr:DUF305 domain-containing protein [Paenibacillus pini]GAF08452.1 hypothetical protein JCM16418_2527 [Paenibacillus pini JCM 16418]
MKKRMIGLLAGLTIWMLLTGPQSYIQAADTDDGSVGKKPGASKEQVKETKEEAYIQNYDRILRTMKERMSSAPKTGDPTVDFLYEMIPHHMAAISMSENLISYVPNGNAEVKKLAETIIREQTDGVSRMNNLLERIKNSPQIDIAQEEAYLKGYEEAYKAMIARMERSDLLVISIKISWKR